MKKMNKYLFNLSCILAILFCVSCRHTQNSPLLLVESIIEDKPDSAYTLLLRISPDDLRSEADKAKFRLLKTQSLVKLDSLLTDDSMIKLSLDYYSNHGPSVYYLKALFYTAWIQYSNNQSFDSMSNAIEAYDIAVRQNDNYWIAKCAELISFIFQKNYNFSEANKYSLKAADEYKKSGRKLNYYWCLIDAANSYSGLLMIDSTLCTLSRLPAPRNYQDSAIRSAALETKLIALFNKGDLKKADSVFTEMTKLNDFFAIQSIPYHIKAMILCKNGLIERVPDYLQIGDSLVSDVADSAVMQRAHMLFAINRGDFETACRIADTLLNLNSRVSHLAYKYEATLAQRDYYNKKSEQEHIRAERQRFIIIGVSITAILMIIGGIIYYRLNLRMKNLKISDMTSQIRLISERLKHSDEQNSILAQTISEKDCQLNTLTRNNDCTATNNVPYDILKAKVMNVFSRDLRNISTTCNELYNDVDDKTQKILLKKIKSDLENMRSLKNIKTVERLVNQYRNDIMANARKDLKGLDNKNFIIMTLLYSGIDTDLICVLLDIKHNSFGPTKGRLKEKIESLKCPEAMRYTRPIL